MKTTIRHISLAVALFGSVLTANAEPASPGMWRTVKLADGREVRVELRGDEFAHFFSDASGNNYTLSKDGVTYRRLDSSEHDAMLLRAERKRSAVNRERVKRLGKARAATRVGQPTGSYLGVKKGIVILVQYKDVSFGRTHGLSYFKNIINKRNYSSSLGFVGSVKDYFLSQSAGKFELDFDVVGPFTLSHECAYYGGNDSNGNDMRAGSMIQEAVRMADAQVDFSQYDWDKDGYADQVFVVFAGLGEASGGEAETIWPHAHTLEYSNVKGAYVTNDATSYGEGGYTVVNTYACGSELRKVGTVAGLRDAVAGIGTICHEFSHCLGYPDLYDTSGGRNFGMGSFDLMSSGNHNNNGLCPPNYSAYEKWFAGWIEPTVLDKPATVKGVRPQDAFYGESYIIYNDEHPDEYYLLENRQNNIGIWDRSIQSSGLMITHVDYSPYIWNINKVNAFVNYSDQLGEGYAHYDNDHQRLTIYHADNETSSEAGDLYPYNGNNSLTETSTPAAMFYNSASIMGKTITNITQNADGTIDFDFMGGSADNVITGIDNIRQDAAGKALRIYSVEGTYMGNSLETLPHGVYIVNGKKVVR